MQPRFVEFESMPGNTKSALIISAIKRNKEISLPVGF
jgi:hypothetical protein